MPPKEMRLEVHFATKDYDALRALALRRETSIAEVVRQAALAELDADPISRMHRPRKGK